MKLLFFVLLFITSYSIKGQDLKKKRKIHNEYMEIFYVEKKTKKKTGSYYKIDFHKKDTMITGYYNQDKKVNTWTYFRSNNKPIIKYNYNTEIAEYISDEIYDIDSCYVKEGDKFILTSVDRPPVYVGYKDEEKMFAARNILLSKEIVENNISGYSLVSFIISTKGRISNITLEKSLEENFDKEIIKVIKQLERIWIPAYKNGEAVDSKILVVFYVQLFKFLESKPYLWSVTVSYGGFYDISEKISFNYH